MYATLYNAAVNLMTESGWKVIETYSHLDYTQVQTLRNAIADDLDRHLEVDPVYIIM